MNVEIDRPNEFRNYFYQKKVKNSILFGRTFRTFRTKSNRISSTHLIRVSIYQNFFQNSFKNALVQTHAYENSLSKILQEAKFLIFLDIY
jgi:hypothetical protein